MATGTILPLPIPQFLDGNGDPYVGGLLYSYTAGTSTPAALYTDAGLAVPFSNPLVLNASGRPDGPIYASLTSYKLVLKDAGGVTIWTADNVQATSVSAANAIDNAPCHGRLTLASGTAIPAADVTGATAVYFTPYQGNKISLYDGTSWGIYTFSELSINLGSDPATRPYDVFAFVSSGIVVIQRLAWNNDTTRDAGLVSLDGVLVNSQAVKQRYLGTYRTLATGQTEDSFARRFVWNYYNRKPRAMQVLEMTDSWAYTTPTYRQANGSASNKLAFVVGVQEVTVEAEIQAHVLNTNNGVNVSVSVGVDSTSVSSAMRGQLAATASTISQVRASSRTVPTPGYHELMWLEQSAATGTTTWYGDGGDVLLNSGIYGRLDG